jgi:hypothetical protein
MRSISCSGEGAQRQGCPLAVPVGGSWKEFLGQGPELKAVVAQRQLLQTVPMNPGGRAISLSPAAPLVGQPEAAKPVQTATAALGDGGGRSPGTWFASPGRRPAGRFRRTVASRSRVNTAKRRRAFLPR